MELNDKKNIFENSPIFKDHLKIFEIRKKQIEKVEYKLSSIAVKALDSKITGLNENLMAELSQVISLKNESHFLSTSDFRNEHFATIKTYFICSVCH